VVRRHRRRLARVVSRPSRRPGTLLTAQRIACAGAPPRPLAPTIDLPRQAHGSPADDREPSARPRGPLGHRHAFGFPAGQDDREGDEDPCRRRVHPRTEAATGCPRRAQSDTASPLRPEGLRRDVQQPGPAPRCRRRGPAQGDGPGGRRRPSSRPSSGDRPAGTAHRSGSSARPSGPQSTEPAVAAGCTRPPEPHVAAGPPRTKAATALP
jgi:hypothetical protein